MIVKVALASAVLAVSTPLIVPIALAAGGTDSCVERTTVDTPSTPAPRQLARMSTVPAKTSAPPAPTDCKTPTNSGGALPGAEQAVAQALDLVGSHGYYQLCARLAANIWGRPRAGYFSAAEQWRHMVATNNAHRGDRQPPAGALMFWETGGPYGHVAVYVGNGRVVSNDIGDAVPGEGGVYLVDFGLIEAQWGATYLGWAPPIYSTT